MIVQPHIGEAAYKDEKMGVPVLAFYSLSDQATRIVRGAHRSDFHYHNGQRIVHRNFLNGQLTARTHYIGSVEVYQPTGAGRQFRRMIGGVAIATWFEASDVTQTSYLHKDHLGSITATSNAHGQVTSWMSYDPWGKRRHGDAWHPWQAPNSLFAMLAITPRGYTGHEHLDDLGIIHMTRRAGSTPERA